MLPVIGLLIGAILYCSPVFAAEQGWLSLLHYQSTSFGEFESSIAAPEFFLTVRGQQDPDAEWAASREAMTNSASSDVDAQCQFPARALYLQRQGLIVARPCPTFEKWKRRFPLESLSLVFSTAYTGNAASMFGHTFLKLNLIRGQQNGAELLDFGLGFLANANPEDGASYVFKGFFGGYPGYFTLQPYYELVNQYAYAENRDLWELKIPLSPDELDLFLAHLWELVQRAGTPYYFTHVNCSSMLAEVLDAIKPDWQLRSQLHGFVLPSQLMRMVSAAQAEDHLIFRPSQRRRFSSKLKELSLAQKSLFRESWKDRGPAVAARDPAVLDVLLDRIHLEKSSLDLAAQYRLRDYEEHTLLARSALPGAAIERIEPARNNPLLGHAPALLSLTNGVQDENPYLGLRLRWGWHDILDPEAGFEPNSHLNILDLRWRAAMDSRREDELQFRLAEIWSLYPWTTDQPHLSWTLGGGMNALRAGNNWTQSLVMDGSLGVAFGGPTVLIAVMPGVHLGQPLHATDEVLVIGRLNMLARVHWHSRFRSLFRWAPGLRSSDGRYETNWDVESRADLLKEWQAISRVAHSDRVNWELGLARNF